MVSVLDSGAEGPGFKSQTVHIHRASVHQATKLIAALLRVVGVTAGLAVGPNWQATAGFMTHVTCRLTAKNRDQLRNLTLGNRVWATFLHVNLVYLNINLDFLVCTKQIMLKKLKPLRSVKVHLTCVTVSVWDTKRS